MFFSYVYPLQYVPFVYLSIIHKTMIKPYEPYVFLQSFHMYTNIITVKRRIILPTYCHSTVVNAKYLFMVNPYIIDIFRMPFRTIYRYLHMHSSTN